MFTSDKDDWGTPPELYAAFDREFGFTLDACAMPWNAKHPVYFTPEDDALKQDWSGHVVWCNPPYGKGIERWMRKAYEESLKGATVVVLTFSRTDTRWWHDWVEGKATPRFLKGRVRFLRPDGVKGTAPAPSVALIYRPRSTDVRSEQHRAA